MAVIRIMQSGVYDPAIVAEVLGSPPLPLDQSRRGESPFITIDGRIHRPTSDYLRWHCGGTPNPLTAKRIATDLVGWLDFLINVRGYDPHEDHRDPLLVAIEEDFAAYYRLLQHGPTETRISSPGWAKKRSAIKRVYEFTQRRYHHKPPMVINGFNLPNGIKGTTIRGYQPRRRNVGSAGTPLTPEYAELLLMGALRVDSTGEQDMFLGADRDHAFISLALASGMRKRTLSYLTHYEVPRPASSPFTTMVIPHAITKGQAGGDALVFSHSLDAVHDYMKGSRADVAALGGHTPDEPLPIVSATSRQVTYRTAVGSPEVETIRWTDADMTFRLRLVEVDGSSPVLFLKCRRGGPLTYNANHKVVLDASKFVRERIDSDFPEVFRLHDLRHTYAVHLTIAIFRDVVSKAVDAKRSEDWQVEHIAAAFELAKGSLGHVDEQSTRLYTRTAYLFLDIPIGQFFGDFS